MDPEVSRQLEEAFIDLTRTSGRLGVGLAILSDGLAKTGKAMGASDEALKRYNAAVNANARAVDGNTDGFKGNSDALKQNTEMMYALKMAGRDAGAAVLSLGKTLLDAKGSFGAYGDAVNKAGGAAADLASEFGIVGKILGLFIKAGTKVVEAQLKQADNVIKGVDQLGKLGAAGAMTGDQLIKAGHKAGYTSAQLDKLIKPIESMKSGLVVLGGNAQEGAKEFTKLAAVGQQTRESFRRLGVSQEELTQHQADFVALQAKSGRSISQEMKDRGGLQKASLEYTKNLVELSAITGKSVEEAKKELEATQSTYTRALANAQLGAEEAKLRKVMNSEADADQKAKAKARLEEIESIKKSRDQVDKALSSVPLNEAQKAAYQEFIESGVRTKEFNDTFGQLNINFEDQRKKFLSGQMSEGEFRESLKKGILDRVEQVGDSARIAGEDFGKQVGLGAEMVKFAASNSANDLAEGAKDAKAKIGDAAEGKGPVGEDPLQKARNTMAESEIKAATAADALAWSTNAIAKGYFPDLGNAAQKLIAMLEKAVEFITKFWKEISIAIGVLMGIKGLSMLKGAASAVGGVGRGLATVGKGVLGKVALPVAGAIAAYDAYKGFQADKDAPLTQRLKNAGSSALSGVTFGMLGKSSEDIAAEKAAKAGGPTAVGAPPAATTKPPVDEKLVKDWAWTVYSGLKTLDQVPGSIRTEVSKYLMSPPASWTPEVVRKAQEARAKQTAPQTQTAQTPAQTTTPAAATTVATQKPTPDAQSALTQSGGAGSALDQNTKALNNLTLQISKLGTGTQSLADASKSTTSLGLKTADSIKKLTDEAIAKTGVPKGSQLSDTDSVKKMTDEMFAKVKATKGSDTDSVKKLTDDMFAKMGVVPKGSQLGDGESAKKMADEIFAKVGGQQDLQFGKSQELLKDIAGQKTSDQMMLKMQSDLKDLSEKQLKEFEKTGLMTAEMKKAMVDPFADMGSGDSASAMFAGMPVGKMPGFSPQLMKMMGQMNAMPGGIGGGSMPAMGGGGGGGSIARPPMESGGGGGGGGGGILGGLWSGLMGLFGKGGDGPQDDVEGKVGGGGGADPKDQKSGSAAHGPRKETKGLLVHHTGGRGLQTAMDTLKSRGLGYHYLVDRDGTVVNYVSDEQKAWHAGKTDKKPDVTNANSVSISLVAKDDKDLTKEQKYAAFGLGQKLMSKYGISSVYGHGEAASHKHAEEGKTIAAALRAGRIEAKDGGIAKGPRGGYPATLHGNEIIVPLDPNSILAELGKKPVTEIAKDMQDKVGKMENLSPEAFKELTSINQAMMEMMANKLDSVINRLESSNDTQNKILKYSQA